jgi:Kef-type K+ transport system membrane component KefB
MFFFITGLSVDIGALRAGDLGLLLLVSAVAITGKVGAGALGARWSGMAWRESAAIGILLDTRGLTELIALTVGLQSGIIDHRIYTVLVLMAVLTTFLTRPLLAWLDFPRAGDHALPSPPARRPASGPGTAAPSSLP